MNLQTRSCWLVITSLLLCGAVVRAGPATLPAADPELRIGEVDLQTVAPFTYAFVRSQTTLTDLHKTIGELVPKIEDAISHGVVHPSGAMVFTYNGATGEPDKKFDLRVGVYIDRKVEAGSGIETSDEPALKCATLVYRGSLAHLKEAFAKLYQEIGARGLTPTDVSREIYLYWEGPDSPNNVIQLQAELN
jgi:effector-binding domain-containing protein